MSKKYLVMNSLKILRCIGKFDRSCGCSSSVIGAGGYFLAASQVVNQAKCLQQFSTTTKLEGPPPEFPPNSSIVPQFINNRNPRNLEKLRIGEKPTGWELERESKTFWNKVTLEISSKHITAQIVHHLGQKPISVSTKEWCLKKYLYSTNDASAAKLVGQVLARRCLQSGITDVACFFPDEDRSKEKVSVFLQAFEEGGVALSEPSQVLPDWDIHNWQPRETPWDVHEDVDDKVDIAAKMQGFKERKRKVPKWYEVKDI